MSIESGLDLIWASDFVQANPKKSYKAYYNSEYLAVADYLNGGPEPNFSSFSKLGKGLCEIEKARRVLEPEIPPDPPPPTGYPTSYTNGPLGSRNILPADSAGALTCLWHGVNGLSSAGTKQAILQRIQDVGRSFDGIGHQLDQLTADGVKSEDWVRSLGSFSIVTWAPSATIAQVNAGAADAAFVQVADRYKAFGDRIMLRPWHEFNGDWFAWAVGNDGPAWIQAWKRMVGIFKTRGADNVGFVWCPTEGQDRARRDSAYPGDEWVDWVSTTAYNACWNTQDWCCPLHGGWATFREIFDYTNLGSNLVSTYSAYGHRKPFVITESGSKCRSDDATAKGNWFRAVDSEGKQNMPNLRGVVWFDQDVSSSEPGNDWRVDRCQDHTLSSASYQGFKELVSKARWKVGIA